MTQTDRILEMLETAGSRGVSNFELNSVAFRYAARLHDLKKRGIEVISEHVRGSEWRFKLKENKWQGQEPEGLKLKKPSNESTGPSMAQTPTSTPTMAQKEEEVKNTPQTSDRSPKTLSWLELLDAKAAKSRDKGKPKENTGLTCKNCGLSVRECKCSMWVKK